MKKKMLVSIIGLSMITLTGCTDVSTPVPSNPTPTQMKTHGEMISYCKGMIAGEVNTKPMYVEMGKLIVEQGAKPASKVSGTVNGKKYTCQFDTESNFVGVYAN